MKYEASVKQYSTLWLKNLPREVSKEGSGNSKHLICMIAPSFIAMLCVHIMIILIQQIVKMRLRNCSELEC